MMEAHTAKVQDPESVASETEAPAARRPIRELLPRDERALGAGALSVILLAASFVVYGLTAHALIGAVLCPALVLLAAIDLEHQLLPNDVILPAVLAIGLILAAANASNFLTHLAAAAALGGFFLVFVLLFKGGLGMGDAKFGFLLGLGLGWRTVSAAVIALAGLLVAALWILATQGLKARRKGIPFGPFLAFGGIIAYFLG